MQPVYLLAGIWQCCHLQNSLSDIRLMIEWRKTTTRGACFFLIGKKKIYKNKCASSYFNDFQANTPTSDTRAVILKPKECTFNDFKYK